MTNLKKYGTLLSLYLAQSIPMSFFSTVVPVIMRQENYSLESIGYWQLIKLPWIIKFLWAPLLDRKGRNRGDYRKMILVSEIFYAVVILSIGFFEISTDFKLIVILMVIAFVASATQDIATDAFAILTLKKKERGLGNSMQSAGSFLGTLVGSGVLLIIYHHYGWQGLLAGLAGFVLLALIPLYGTKKFEPNEEIEEKERPVAGLKDIGSFFGQKKTIRQVLTLFLFYSGLIGILAMLKPYFVDLGFEADKIGFISGIFGTSCGAVAALGAGFIVKRITARKALILFSFVNMLAASLFLLFEITGNVLRFIYPLTALIWTAYGMSTVAIYTMAMNWVRPGREGTDFTIQIVLTHLSSLFMAVFSGRIADMLGYVGLFQIEAIIGLSVFILIVFLNQNPKENANTR
ncbi:MAG: MFS transporter [Bacteroidota bacterium]